MIDDRRLSNRLLAFFLHEYGEALFSDGKVVSTYSYEKSTEDLPVPQECVGLRKWTDEEFHDVTVHYTKPWTPEKVYDELVQIFGKDLFSYGAGFLGPSTKYEGKTGKYEISGVLGIHADLYIEDGAIKSKETIPYETFSDSNFKTLVKAIKTLEGL
jgi:hypothetical protein